MIFLFRQQQVKESPKRKMQRHTEVTNNIREVGVTIYNEPLKSPTRGRGRCTSDRKLGDEVKQSPKQKGIRVTKGKGSTEEVPVTEARPTRGTRARLNTNNEDNQNKMSRSPKAKRSTASKASTIVSQSEREISQETLSRSNRLAKVKTSVTVIQSVKGRKRKIDQLIDSRPEEAALKPKRTRYTRQQVPLTEKKSPKRKQTKSQESRPSPKKTRGAKVTVESPVKGSRSQRNKVEDRTVTNTKKNRMSLVISRKPPVMSPQAATNTRKAKKRISPTAESTKRSVSTLRTKSEIKLRTPKAVKTNRAKLVVVTPSPKTKLHVKTRARTRGPTKESPKNFQPETTKRGRRNTGKPEENTLPAQSKERSKFEQESKTESPKKRGRRIAVKVQQNTLPAQSKVRSNLKQESKTDSPKKRGRRTANKSVIVEEPPNKRSRKIAEKPEGKQKNTIEKSTSVETHLKRGNIARSSVTQPVKTVTKPQGKKVAVQESTQSEPVKRSCRTKTDSTSVLTETRKGRKRKNEDEQQAVPPKVAKGNRKVTSGRKTEDVTGAWSTAGRQKRSAKDIKAETLKNEKHEGGKSLRNRTTPSLKVAKETTKKPVKGNKVGLNTTY